MSPDAAGSALSNFRCHVKDLLPELMCHFNSALPCNTPLAPKLNLFCGEPEELEVVSLACCVSILDHLEHV